MRSVCPSRLLSLSLCLVTLTGVVSCGSSATSPSAADAGSGSLDAITADAITVDAIAADAQSVADGASTAFADDAPDGLSTAAQGQPIDAPDGRWTWVPFPDAFCANGTTTGLGVNLRRTSPRVLIYLQGGGACWSDITCNTLMTAVNFATGYSAATFAGESSALGPLSSPGGFFDRSSQTNPFKDYSYVYVPYCTGDLHAGSNVVQYGTATAMHVGSRNLSAFLNRIVPTFSTAERVYLAGSSAGGFGALINWWKTQAAFGGVRVDMIDDSGLLMPPDIAAQGNGAEPVQRTQWNLAATLPPGCADCGTNSAALYEFYAKAFPTHRAALLSHEPDPVIASFDGITLAQFTTGLEEVLTRQLAPNPNFISFVAGTSGHVLWSSPSLAVNGVTVEQFLTRMANDDPAAANVHF
ncbi:MAG: pectinacetylesterase family protein [Myxococcota bacterium]|nr:pectinacetylesterase family protein [Myxococcota bacterium]